MIPIRGRLATGMAGKGMIKEKKGLFLIRISYKTIRITVKREIPDNCPEKSDFSGIFRVKENSGLTRSGLDREYSIRIGSRLIVGSLRWENLLYFARKVNKITT